MKKIFIGFCIYSLIGCAQFNEDYRLGGFHYAFAKGPKARNSDSINELNTPKINAAIKAAQAIAQQEK